MSKPRVLLIAEAANPSMVSVPLVGWSHCRAIQKLADAHIVTQVRNRWAIGQLGPIDESRFSFIDNEAISIKIGKISEKLRGGKNRGWTLVSALSNIPYRTFEKMVWARFKDDLKAGKYDIVHRITPLSPTTPSKLARWCAKAGVPFVLGPLNGGVPWPKAFDSVRREEKEWLSYVRDGYKLMPGFRATRKYSKAILIASRDTWEQMPARYHDKCFYIPENAIEPERFSLKRTRRAGRPIRAVFIGRLVPYKGADMLIEAAEPLLKSGGLTIKIIGDGPQMAQLKEMIATRQLGDAVELSGWIKHTKIQNQLVDQDVLAFPSIREFGGGVALEAMAIGLVPIVMNYGGLGELVTEKTGFLLNMSTRPEIITQLRNVMEKIVTNPQLIDDRSEPAWQRAHQQFSWEAKARQVMLVYDWVLGRGPKPAFPMPVEDLG